MEMPVAATAHHGLKGTGGRSAPRWPPSLAGHPRHCTARAHASIGSCGFCRPTSSAACRTIAAHWYTHMSCTLCMAGRLAAQRKMLNAACCSASCTASNTNSRRWLAAASAGRLAAMRVQVPASLCRLDSHAPAGSAPGSSQQLSHPIFTSVVQWKGKRNTLCGGVVYGSTEGP